MGLHKIIGKLTRVQDVRSAGKKVVQFVIYAACHLCSLSFMQPVICAVCNLCSKNET